MNFYKCSMIWMTLLLCADHADASSIASAIAIASKGLDQNIATLPDPSNSSGNHQYLLAGSHQYHSLWAWDFAFASFGALKAGKTHAVRDSLEIYFSFQRPDGLLPRVIDHQGITERVMLGMIGIVLPFKGDLHPQFETENKVISYIPNVIFPWAANRYIQYTNDSEFARRYFTNAERAIDWMDANALENGLICKQAPYSDWEDSVQRTGCVAFTNELYALSLRSLSEWAKYLGDEAKAQAYQNRYEEFLIRFHAYFWDAQKNVIRNFTGDEHLTADANLLAVAYHLVDLKDATLMMNTLRTTPLFQPMPGRPTWPNYPNSMKSELPKLVGLAGYHDEIYWGWIASLAAIAEKEVGNPLAAQKILESFADEVLKDGAVFEVYDLKKRTQSLKPVRRLLYRAERPFTWSSGFFLEAALN